MKPLRHAARLRAALVALCVCAAFALGVQRAEADAGAVASDVLFIGNSLTYTNDLPAVAEAVSAGTLQADMFVRPGATLSELLGDQRLGHLVASGRYEMLVVQERGGDVLCLHGAKPSLSAACAQMQSAHLDLARVAREAGAKVVYLGTYQPLPAASMALVKAEGQLSDLMGAQYAQISERMREGRSMDRRCWNCIVRRKVMRPGSAFWTRPRCAI